MRGEAWKSRRCWCWKDRVVSAGFPTLQKARGEKRYSPCLSLGEAPGQGEQEAVLKASLFLLTSGQALAAAFLPAVELTYWLIPELWIIPETNEADGHLEMLALYLVFQ